MIDADTRMDDQKQLRILVAEDNEINQQLILRILERAGYATEIAANGREAVELAGRHPYDFILMDIQMPLLDGQQAAKRIRMAENSGAEPDQKLAGKIPDPKSPIRGVPIVAMTGSNPEVEKEKCLQMGMNDCLGKPLFREQLISSITKWTATEPVGGEAGQVREDVDRQVARTPGTHRPIDLEKALNEFMGEREVLFSLLKEFTAKVRSQIKAIRQAILGMDFKAIAKDAHSIKGGAANLTAKNVAGIASALEKAANLKQVELAKNLAGELEEKLHQLENYLQQANISISGV